MLNLSGIYVPLISQFTTDGEVDAQGIADFTEIMLANQVHGVVASGTTGESYALSMNERRLVIETIVKQVNGRVPVLAGVGGLSTRDGIEQARLAAELGCDGLMVAAPAYVLPTPIELVAHIEQVIESAGLPSVLYDYPARTGVSFDQDVLDVLAGHALVLGIKEASGDLSRIPMLRQRYAGRIEGVCGADVDAIPFFEAGITSWIGGIANALPKAHIGIMEESTREQAYLAVRPILQYIEEGRYIAKTKALMGLLGVPSSITRGPLKSLESEGIEVLRELVSIAGEWAPQLV